ncbi:MAG: AraC family transcriptional regulator [Cellvibrionaceae bacterium]|nr:AraC family transcriptional regulator [Cellvibrionaceae bacterium]MCV6627106.1 AraC family transcriptional regulator [Cellvibrionaceae bacterium]
MNEVEQIAEIDQLIEPGNSRFQSVSTSLGEFWRSCHDVQAPISYETQLPAGLHLGAGIAKIRVGSSRIGEHRGHGPLLSVLYCPPGLAETFHTHLEAGQNTSCGLYICHDQFAQLASPLRKLMQLIPSNKPFYASSRCQASVVNRLCAPFEDWQQTDALELAGEARAYELLAQLSESTARRQPKLKQHLQHQLDKAKSLIDQNLAKPPSLTELAQAVGLNVRSLSAYFRQAYGVSVGEYQHQQRMALSLQLLEQGFSVSQAADQVGYSLPYFSRKFQQRYGIAARDMCRQAQDD